MGRKISVVPLLYCRGSVVNGLNPKGRRARAASKNTASGIGIVVSKAGGIRNAYQVAGMARGSDGV